MKENKILTRNINDIISGDILTLRDGDVGIVIDTHLGKLIQFEDGTWDNFNLYTENLCSNKSDFDIIKVSRIFYEKQILPKNFNQARVIWERKENHTIEENEEETVIRIPKGVEFEFKTK